MVFWDLNKKKCNKEFVCGQLMWGGGMMVKFTPEQNSRRKAQVILFSVRNCKVETLTLVS